MDLIDDTLARHEEVERAIRKHGWSVEHNFWHWQNNCDKGTRNVFFRAEDDMGVLANHNQDTNAWSMFSEVLAPEGKRVEVFLAFLKEVLEVQKGKKVTVELEAGFRRQVLQAIKGKYHASRPSLTLTWPVFEMDKWDPALPGGDWKKLRNIINTFYRDHKVEAVPSRDVPQKQLLAILDAWKKGRPKTDRTYSSHYLTAIKTCFRGFDMVRTLVIDGEPCTITGGWAVPNSGVYYSCFGLHNYKYDRLGEIANIDDLNELKRQGRTVVDFGGSDGGLLEFKKKFRPHRYYDTITFSIRMP